MTDELTEEELLAQQEEDPEAYVERVQSARDAENARLETEDDIARERTGRPTREQEERDEQKLAKAAEKAEKAEEKEAEKEKDQ
jgi:hypothetical protein